MINIKRDRSCQLFWMATAFMLVSTAVSVQNQVFAEKKDIRNQNCEMFYSIYKEKGETKFKNNYQNTPTILDCLRLYKYSSWNFAGKAGIDGYFDSLKPKSKTSENPILTIDILTKDPIGKLKQAIKFKACSDQTMSEPYFLIKSDGYSYLAFSSTILQASKCQTFKAEINAVSPNSIQVEPVIDHSKYKSLKIKGLYLVG